MTALLIIQTTIIWVILGCFISYKRKWYRNNTDEEQVITIAVTIIFSPIALVIALFKQFILEDWNNS